MIFRRIKMTDSVSLFDAVQVLIQRPCSGEPIGWATTDFCNAVAAITHDSSSEVKNGYAGAIVMTSFKAKKILTSLHSDLAAAVEAELAPAFEGKISSEVVETVKAWVEKNTGRFSPALKI